MTKTQIVAVAGTGLVAAALCACRVGDVGGNVVRNAFGHSGRAGDVAAATFQSASDIVQQVNTRFSPEQEYYLGRAVAANFVARYGLDPDEARQETVRRIGAALVSLSSRIRTTYGGY